MASQDIPAHGLRSRRRKMSSADNNRNQSVSSWVMDSLLCPESSKFLSLCVSDYLMGRRKSILTWFIDFTEKPSHHISQNCYRISLALKHDAGIKRMIPASLKLLQMKLVLEVLQTNISLTDHQGEGAFHVSCILSPCDDKPVLYARRASEARERVTNNVYVKRY